MTVYLHLRIVGALLLTLGLAHGAFGRYFKWREELAQISLLTRQVFWVHSFFVAMVVTMIGGCSLFYTHALLESVPLSRVVLAGLVIFWTVRLVFQWFVYDSAIWRGRTFYTVMHVVFSAFWIYATVTYGVAFRLSQRL